MEIRKLNDRINQLESKITQMNEKIEELEFKHENMDDFLSWNYVKLKKYKKMKEKLNNLIFQLAVK